VSAVVFPDPTRSMCLRRALDGFGADMKADCIKVVVPSLGIISLQDQIAAIGRIYEPAIHEIPLCGYNWKVRI